MGGADLDLGRIDLWKRVIQGHDVTVTERHLSLNDIAYFVSWISIIKSFHEREFKTKQALIFPSKILVRLFTFHLLQVIFICFCNRLK
jgi:hypothetical protein